MSAIPVDEVQAVLVDGRNYASIFGGIMEAVRAAEVMGFDIETEDSRRHDGLNTYMKVDEDGFKSEATRLIFDIPRTTITGFSIWPEGHPYVYYFNMAHADAENRLELGWILHIFEQFKGHLVCHNAPFELTMCKACWNLDLQNVVDSMQLCVTAYGPDEYSWPRFYEKGIENFQLLLPEADRLFRDYEYGQELTSAQGTMLGKVISKESKAAHSYNGWVKDITYGYDLKKAVKSWFGYQMMTFKECLGDKPHMGCLTGDEVVEYGCDDAVWCVGLFRRVLQYMGDTNPAAIQTFFAQENPMIYIYSEVTRNGMRVNRSEVVRHKHMERAAVAPVLRELRGILAEMYRTGNFFQDWLAGELYEEYAIREKDWYRKSGDNTRRKILTWINMGDHADDYEEIARTNGAVAKSWKRENGQEKREGILNLTHYYVVRTLLYDLCRAKPIIGRGKVVESDGDAQNLIVERCGRASFAGRIISCLKRITSIEQRIKLYITPYELLIDPETSKIHSQMNSLLATRRIAASFPNFMQLPKSGGGAYVRSFFLPDKPDHVLLSLDWSQIELVMIAEESQDPEMLKCYQQIPYDDLHRIAYMAVLEFTDEILSQIKRMPATATELLWEGVGEDRAIRFEDKNGAPLTPQAYIKYVRKEIGKVSNFNYWYSGALASIGEMMGWTSEQMWAATDRYRNRFPTAEEWRQTTQQSGSILGWVELCDHLRRVRLEATSEWADGFRNKFQSMPDGIARFFDLCIKNIQRRSRNQFVNTKIQGGCAALAKRTIITSRAAFSKEISEGRLAFKMSIHDELVWSVHKDLVIDFIPRAKAIMCSHADIFPSVLLSATASIGLNFQPFDPRECPYGQIELDEAPEVNWLNKGLWGQALDDANIKLVLNYLAGGVK